MDTAATNGTTVYYVVSALGDAVEGPDSVEVLVALLHAIPYAEDFEARTLGELNGQNGWAATNAVVQSTDALGTKACSITNETGFASQSFFGGHNTVWTDLWIKPVFSPFSLGVIDPDDPTLTTALFFDADGHPAAYDGTSVLCFSNTTVTAGQWVRVTVKSDYASQTWDLYVDGALVAAGLGFYNTATTHYTSFEVTGAGGANAVVDAIRVETKSPLLPPPAATILLLR